MAVATPFLLNLAFDGWIRDYIGPVNFSLEQIPNLSGKTAIVTGTHQNIPPLPPYLIVLVQDQQSEALDFMQRLSSLGTEPVSSW